MPAHTVRSEIAGAVWKVEVAPGQDVEAGEVLLILESMKMEIPVEAAVAGRVIEVLVGEGTTVVEDQALVRLDV